MVWWKKIAITVMVGLVVAGNVALWLGDAYPHEVKLRLTILNGIAWAIIILPAFAVARWAAAHRSDD